MWQRVQTLYLLLATGLVVSLFFCTKAGDIPYTEYWPYLVLLLITGFLQVMALTTWKHRIFQMRTASLSAIILIALQGWLVYDFISTHNTPDDWNDYIDLDFIPFPDGELYHFARVILTRSHGDL